MTRTLTVLRVSSVERTTAGTSDQVLKNLVTVAHHQVKDSLNHLFHLFDSDSNIIFQLMDSGESGQPGQPVTSSVQEESSLGRDTVTLQLLVLREIHVLEKPLR